MNKDRYRGPSRILPIGLAVSALLMTVGEIQNHEQPVAGFVMAVTALALATFGAYRRNHD